MTKPAPAKPTLAATLRAMPILPKEALPCVGAPLIFFPATDAEADQARALCADCPIRAACLAGALDREEPWGVWGGELLLRGEVVAALPRVGRPRKIAA